jgi:L-cystine uptake protein TcyP (sodium:dicarboxylate symporter family)
MYKLVFVSSLGVKGVGGRIGFSNSLVKAYLPSLFQYAV